MGFDVFLCCKALGWFGGEDELVFWGGHLGAEYWQVWDKVGAAVWDVNMWMRYERYSAL